MLVSELSYLFQIPETLFFSNTSESNRRLAAVAVLLGQVNLNSLEDLLFGALKCSEEGTVAVNYDKPELFIISEEALKRRGIEPLVATVHRLVDGTERLEVVGDFLLCLAIVHQDHTAKNDKAIFRGHGVQVKASSCRFYSFEHGISSLGRLYIISLGFLAGKVLGPVTDGLLPTHIERDEGSTITLNRF